MTQIVISDIVALEKCVDALWNDPRSSSHSLGEANMLVLLVRRGVLRPSSGRYSAARSRTMFRYVSDKYHVDLSLTKT
jgi:hypothetical protein